jgi:hypothetical protein
LRKPQALNGGLRQFASVTSRSGAGGKPSIRAAVICPPRFSCSFSGSIFLAPRGGAASITFQRVLNRIRGHGDKSIAVNPRLSGQKSRRPMEQKAVVAAPSQLRTITAPALPRSNQIEATLFD